MVTYQDFEKALSEGRIKEFIPSAISTYKASAEYQMSMLGREYMQQRNRTITQLRKYLYDESGKSMPDNYSANYKVASAYYRNNCIQINQHLLGNGVSFADDKTKKALGGAAFDNKLVQIGRAALSEGVCYGFYNTGKIEIFRFDQFVPLFDEETGNIRAGLRYWQLATNKPLRVTLYLESGYADYMRREGETLINLDEHTPDNPAPYKTRILETVYNTTRTGENYPAFPIIPCYANYDKQAEIVGKQGHIDCYDLVESGFANNVDEASFIYWILQNTGGMDEIDLAEFKERIKSLHVAKTDNQTDIQAHSVDVPTEAREALLTRLERDIYNDAMTVDTHDIASGNVTATAIRAAYKRLNDRVDEYEYCIIDFIHGLLDVAGIEDEPSFSRAVVTNEEEITQMVLSAAEYLDTETILSKLPWLTPEERQLVFDRKAAENIDRLKIIGG